MAQPSKTLLSRTKQNIPPVLSHPDRLSPEKENSGSDFSEVIRYPQRVVVFDTAFSSMPKHKYSVKRLGRGRVRDTTRHGTALCRNCEKSVPFNDQMVGECVKNMPSGDIVLRMGDGDPIGIRLPYKRYDNLPGLPSLENSAKRGCNFCAFLRQSILMKRYNYNAPVRLELSYQWDRSTRPGEQDLNGLSALVVLMTVLPSTGNMEQKHFLTFTVEAKQGTHATPFQDGKRIILFRTDKAILGHCATWLGIKSSPEETSLCRKNVIRIRAKLAKCRKTCCPPTSTTPFIPARLIDLGQMDGSVPRLIVTKRVASIDGCAPDALRSGYAALSYCWGPPEASMHLKTQRHSLKSRMDAIPIQSMPQALQDAIIVCRALAIRFLWVDCLCIIQDDQHDWAKESAEMGRIYENALLTICALASSSSSQGFLSRTLPTIEIDFQSKLYSNISGFYDLTFRPRVDEEWVTAEEYTPFFLDHYYSPWKERGWTHQEETMSTRILYFGESRIHLCCRSLTYTENSLEGDQPSFQGFLSHTLATFQKQDCFCLRSRNELYQTWYMECGIYNTKQLTRKEDKFPALAGMAKSIAEIVSDEYLAGLWRKDLVRGLMWHAPADRSLTDHIQVLTASNPSNAPSWSWASHSKGFEVGSCLFDPDLYVEINQEVELLEAKVDLATSNPFGRINGAAMTLNGKMVPVPHTIFYASVQMMSRIPVWDIKVSGRCVFSCVFDWVCPRKAVQPPDGLSMLKLGSGRRWRGKARVWKTVVWGVLLFPTEKSAEYRRVGIFTSHNSEHSGIDLFKHCKPQRLRLI